MRQYNNFQPINLIKQNQYISTECGHSKPNQIYLLKLLNENIQLEKGGTKAVEGLSIGT